MLKLLRLFCAGAGWLCAIAALAQEPKAVRAQPVDQQRAIVYAAAVPTPMEDFGAVDPGVERHMVDRLVLALTGQADLGKAWQMLVRPDDYIGIKINTLGGQLFSTHRGIVAAIVAGLQQAGIPRSSIVVWDREARTLREAGYVSENGLRVRSVDQPGGLDPQATFTAPTLGLLIWGDLSFRGESALLTREALWSTRMSAESHIARLLSHEVTRIISVPTFSDEPGCGVAGALYNVTVPNVDNSRRFTQIPGSSSICDLFADPRIGPKVTLTIVDGLLAQYAGGPTANPNYMVQHRTLYASRDPVALDATMLRKLETWRREANLPAIGERADWLREAQAIGLGCYDEQRISLQRVSQ